MFYFIFDISSVWDDLIGSNWCKLGVPKKRANLDHIGVILLALSVVMKQFT